MSQVQLNTTSLPDNPVAESESPEVSHESVDIFERALGRREEKKSDARQDNNDVSDLLENIRDEAPSMPYSRHHLTKGPKHILENGSVSMTRKADGSLDVLLQCSNESARPDYEALKGALQNESFGVPCTVHLEMAVQNSRVAGLGKGMQVADAADFLLRQVPAEGQVAIKREEGTVFLEKSSDGSLSVRLTCEDRAKLGAFQDLSKEISGQCEKKGMPVSVSVELKSNEGNQLPEDRSETSHSMSELLGDAFKASFFVGGGQQTAPAAQEVSRPSVQTPKLTTEKLEQLVQRILVADTGGTKEVRLTLSNNLLNGTDVVLSRSNDGMVSVRLLCSDRASFQTAIESRQDLVDMLSKNERSVRVTVEQTGAGGDEQGNDSQRRSQTYQEYPQDDDR